MPAHVSRPQTVVGDHKVTTAEIADDIRAHHAGHPRLRAILRVVENCGVRTRNFTRPLNAPTVSGAADIGERARAAFADALDMSERAAAAALRTAGLAARDIDAIVTTHSTGWSVPNLDVHLIARLGLRPTVRRVALTTLACPGGTHCLMRAADMVAARPGSKVLVVAAEVISSVYHHSDTGIESMIYKALFGDSAAAAVVSDTPLGPGIAIEDSFEYVLPDSVDRQRGRISPDGFHFDSTKKALTAADDALPALTEWVGTEPVDFAAIHPGSLRIIADTAAALGLDDHAARHSTDTLCDEGNLGGVSILRVIERTHAAPPADRARGVVVAFGPGFSTAALRCHWHA
ncbi:MULTISPECIES: PhlD [unclassified Streptomyces]|uniref:PhlD n=1 Tax=unclassified Streptomyces TaxID=2593676 RepID=UPI000747B13E|nr:MULTISPECIES: PhlD [unclassified Streptomyces]KUL54165.1 PhlD [Streptomyces sp. NRRL S-1521]THC55358.1 PhlD [Streptomyces sp. A1499]